jgi:hypothetical protein
MSNDQPRTDPHRPGAIVPQDYQEVLWFDCGGGDEPSYGVNCMKPVFDWFSLQAIPGATAHRADGTCCVLGLREAGRKFANTGREHGAGKCTVCGAYFRYGFVWEHLPTGELIYVGHDCADNYGLVASHMSRAQWKQYQEALGRKRAIAAKEHKRATARDKFIAANDLASVFEVRDQHNILADMYNRLHQWGSLSEKQVAFARKLADEVRNPKPKVEEVKVAAPSGRVTFTGTIVSCKWQEGYTYGDAGRAVCTVKVTTPEGIWLAWGTLPSAVDGNCDEQRGRTITLTGTLSAGNEPHFAFFKRPTLVDVSERESVKADREAALKEERESQVPVEVLINSQAETI